MSGTVERPTFSYNNDNTKPIRAGGVILYKRTNNNIIEILLIKKLIVSYQVQEINIFLINYIYIYIHQNNIL